MRLPAEVKIVTDQKEKKRSRGKKKEELMETNVYFSYDNFRRYRTDFITTRKVFHINNVRAISVLWASITSKIDINISIKFVFTTVIKKMDKNHEHQDIFSIFAKSDEYRSATERLEEKKPRLELNSIIRRNKEKYKDQKKEDPDNNTSDILTRFTGKEMNTYNKNVDEDRNRSTFSGLDRKKIGFFPKRRTIKNDDNL